MSDPLTTTVPREQFLLFAVAMERRSIRQQRGADDTLPPLPPCPVCSQPVTSVTRRCTIPDHYSIGLQCHRMVSRGDTAYELEREAKRIARVEEGDAHEPPALTSVRALHRPVKYGGMTICVECSALDGQSIDNAPVAHPCATIRAIDGENA